MTTTSLPEDVHLEILKRLLPTPQVLARASAVCREWRRVVNDPAFLLELHPARRWAPVTLGFFHDFDDLARRFTHVDSTDPVRISYDSIDQIAYDSIDHQKANRQLMDCRHGRVLLHDKYQDRYIVWQPMTGDRHLIKHEGVLGVHGKQASIALICECDADDGGDDDDRKLGKYTLCHASHFRVVVVCNHMRTGSLEGTVFSSFTGKWSALVELPPENQIRSEPCVIIGKTMYQPLFDYDVLAFDTDHRTLSTFKRPEWGNVRLLKVDDGVLGLVGVRGFMLRLYVRCADTWVMRKTVDLAEILPSLSTVTHPQSTCVPSVKIIGVAEEGSELFLWTMIGIFMLSIETMELKKVHETTHHMKTVYPYGVFYIPPDARTQRLQLSSRVT